MNNDIYDSIGKSFVSSELLSRFRNYPDDTIVSLSDKISDYISRLTSYDENALILWRLSIAEIFFNGLFSERNSGGEILPVNSHESECNAYYLLEALKANRTIVSFNEKSDALTVYYRNNSAYAVLVPEILILPALEYNEELFLSSRFYDSNSGKLSSVIQHFRKNSDNAVLFYKYLKTILITEKNIIAIHLLNDYIEYLEKELPYMRSLRYSDIAYSNDIKEALDCGYVFSKRKSNTSFCDLITQDIFEENILGFFSEYGKMDNKSIINESSPLHRYKFDYNGNELTPVKLYGLCGEDKDNYIYIIPPFRKTFFCMIEDNSEIEFIRWNAYTSATGKNIFICVKFTINGIEYEEKRCFSLSQLTIVRQMPYLFIWPCVQVEWHEFYVGIMHGVLPEGIISKDFPKINAEAEITLLNSDELSISPFIEHTDYICKTNGVSENEFILKKTDRLPTAVSFSVGDKCYGFWKVVCQNKIKTPKVYENFNGKICLDFATTSSVVKIFSKNRFFDIKGPGYYIHEIFNPNFGNAEKENAWKNIHDYCIIGKEYSDIRKIYTYAQNNSSISKGNDPSPLSGSSNCIPGRAVMVSPGFLNFSLSENFKNSNTTIYSNLKWPDENNTEFYSSKENARSNFILNILSLALLKARELGCSDVQINISFPHRKIGRLTTSFIDRISEALQQISGYRNPEISFQRESQANAAYFINGSHYGLHSYSSADFKAGFIVADIGGGTTDIVICQGDTSTTPFSELVKGEITLKMAGRELVDIPILLDNNIKNLWEQNYESEFDISRFLTSLENEYSIDTRYSITDEIQRKISSVGVILDNARIRDTFSQRAEKTKSIIRLKYLGMFWLIGKYLKKLKDSGAIHINEEERLVIYLTGCASEGIHSLCSNSEDKNMFVPDCNAAISLGYSNKYASPFFIAINHDSVSEFSVKEAVAKGLAFLPSEERALEQKSKLFSIAKEANSFDAEEDHNSFNRNNVLKKVKEILHVFKDLTSQTLEFHELDDKEKSFFIETIFGKSSDDYFELFSKKISSYCISSEFYALCIVDSYLNLNKSLLAFSNEEVFSSTISDTITIPVQIEDCISPVETNAEFKYNVRFSIKKPSEFASLLNGSEKCSFDADQTTKQLRELIINKIYSITSSGKKYMTFNEFYLNETDFSALLQKELTFSKFADCGLFVEKATLTAFNTLSQEQKKAITALRCMCLADKIKARLSEITDTLPSQGKRELIHERRIELTVKAGTQSGDDRYGEITVNIPIKIKFNADDSNGYFTYRGISLDEIAESVDFLNRVHSGQEVFDSKRFTRRKATIDNKVRLYLDYITGIIVLKSKTSLENRSDILNQKKIIADKDTVMTSEEYRYPTLLYKNSNYAIGVYNQDDENQICAYMYFDYIGIIDGFNLVSTSACYEIQGYPVEKTETPVSIINPGLYSFSFENRHLAFERSLSRFRRRSSEILAPEEIKSFYAPFVPQKMNSLSLPIFVDTINAQSGERRKIRSDSAVFFNNHLHFYPKLDDFVNYEKKLKIYDDAKAIKGKADAGVAELKKYAVSLRSIDGFRDAGTLAQSYEKRYSVLEAKQKRYGEAIRLSRYHFFTPFKIHRLKKAGKIFKELEHYKDSQKLIEKIEEKKNRIIASRTGTPRAIEYIALIDALLVLAVHYLSQ